MYITNQRDGGPLLRVIHQHGALRGHGEQHPLLQREGGRRAGGAQAVGARAPADH